VFYGAGAFTGWITQAHRLIKRVAAGSSVGGPLLLYLQNGIPTGISGAPPPGKSTIKNEDLALFVQDRWQLRPNFTFNYGSALGGSDFPEPVVPPSQTVYASLLTNPNFPSDGRCTAQERVSATPRLCLDYPVRVNQCFVRARYFLRPPEHAVAGRFDH
jgi:hypothetical protein